MTVLEHLKRYQTQLHIDYGHPHEASLGKLTDGPCSKEYEKMAACAKNKGVQRAQDHQGLCRKEMLACPKESNVVVKCIHKHPEAFHFT